MIQKVLYMLLPIYVLYNTDLDDKTEQDKLRGEKKITRMLNTMIRL
jgi:hypothetical protein